MEYRGYGGEVMATQKEKLLISALEYIKNQAINSNGEGSVLNIYEVARETLKTADRMNEDPTDSEKEEVKRLQEKIRNEKSLEVTELNSISYDLGRWMGKFDF